ncbi:tripartite tricarboxylate transporter permease [Salibacterium halotolerans]|uniref:Putative tricarboxylic transport membrane protein n=1 Tax=Salibacterium halotolerans TaxID=1884432 RepID=A0A1I5LCT2_9BACI|nr:tripartite tricarboxylate transporter permease [Salibacterium halotolerans]SFO95058.1 putative tricarboxylic transport membrane protein [Salibacterium halotolerans]
MEVFQEVLSSLTQPFNLIYMIFGVAAGMIVGALPGLTATMAIAVMLPFTFSMPPDTALITLGGIYIGAIFGGCIAAILINTPGTPSSIATTFDGYPMTQQGKPDQALVTAAVSSGIGGVIGGLALLFLTPMLAALALQFGPPEFFWIALLGLTMVATLSSGSLLKGLIGGSIGLLLSTVGLAPIGGDSRFTFGFSQLQAGFELIVMLIAFFCIPQVIRMIKNQSNTKEQVKPFQSQKGVIGYVFKQIFMRPFLILRSAVIGIIVGIIPGAGGNVASLLSYDATVRMSKDQSTFGKGDVRGVSASEGANNAEVGGSLVPLLALGIPGAPPAAVIIGALLMQGIQPGPNLFEENANLIYTFITAFILANVVMLILALFGSKYIGRVINIPTYYLAPAIVFLTIIGSYAIRNNFTDVVTLIIIGLIGYVLSERGFAPAPIVLGLILGPIAEEGLAQSILISEGFFSLLGLFFTRPITLVLMLFCILSLLSPYIGKLLKSQKAKEEQEKEEAEESL